MNTESSILAQDRTETPFGEIRFLFLPDRDLFGRRAERLRQLSRAHPLEHYLTFLALLADAQQNALNRLPTRAAAWSRRTGALPRAWHAVP